MASLRAGATDVDSYSLAFNTGLTLANNKILGFSLESVNAHRSKDLNLWMDGIDSLVLFSPGNAEKNNKLELAPYLPFFSWNPVRRGSCLV